jgi:RNA polymerase sigma factor (sigma-70 family)
MTFPASRSDTELIRAWSVDRCEASFRELVEKYLGLVRGVALRRTGDPQLAEEIAQNVFILTARKAGRLQASPSLAPWLHHCAWSETTSALRREVTRRRRMSQYQSQTPPEPREPADDSGIHHALPYLDEALRALSEADRRIVLMRFYEGHGLREIAAALGRTEAAVRKQCQRALDKLESRFRRKGIPVSAAVLAAGLGGILAQPPSAAAAVAGTVATLTSATAVATATTASASAAVSTAAAAARISAKAVAAAGGGAGAGPAAGAWVLSIFMNAKILTILATAAILSVPLGWQWRRGEQQQEQIARLEAEAAALRRAGSYSSSAGNRNRPPGTSPEADASSRSSAGSGLRAGSASALGFGSDAEEDAWRQKLSNPSERPAALTDRAQAILGERNPARRLKLFSTFMDELKPGDYEAINAGFARQDQQGRLFGPEYELFLATAGSVDGQATLDSIFRWYHASGGTPTGAQQGAMSSWAMEEPVKAIEWWNAQEEGATKNELAKSLISGLALKDINLAWRCLSEFPTEERAPFMGSLVRQQITDQGAEGAAAWLASLESPDQSDTSPLKQRGFDSLYHSLVNVSADKKSEFVDRFAGEPWMAQTSYPGEVASQWAAKDGTQAINWAGSLPESLREGAVLSAFSTWSERRPQEFADWKASHLADPAWQKSLATFDEIIRAREAPPAGTPVPAGSPVSTGTVKSASGSGTGASTGAGRAAK